MQHSTHAYNTGHIDPFIHVYITGYRHSSMHAYNMDYMDPFILGWPPFVDDFAGHPVLLTHLPDRIVNVIGRLYTHVHTLPHPKWHKTKYTNFMAMNKQREMRFI
jgi:hypothetical protein